MPLTIDIGNTNISFGIFKGARLIRRFDIPTKGYSITRLKNGLSNTRVDDAIICSVVPKISRAVEKDLAIFIGKVPIVLGKHTKVPIKNLYRKPAQLGQDRLVNAYAATMLYGAPIIVVDFGTAITFDVVSKKREYLGGMIIPGLEICLEALSQRAALLPEIKLDRPKEFIGRDTKNSILSGIIYGFAGLTDCLITRIRKRTGKDAVTIGTGGAVDLIRRYCKGIVTIDRDLTLKGLDLIYRHFYGSSLPSGIGSGADTVILNP